jgi:hypothetical protein
MNNIFFIQKAWLDNSYLNLYTIFSLIEFARTELCGELNFINIPERNIIEVTWRGRCPITPEKFTQFFR